MKKFFRTFALVASLALLGGAFVSCSDDDDDGGSGSQSAAIPTIPTAKTAGKGETYEGNFTLDLSDTPLSEDGIEKLKEAENISNLVTAKSTDSKDAGKITSAKVSSASEKSLSFDIEYDAPETDSVVIFTVEIPRDYTEDDETVSVTAGVLKVGDGVTVSEDTVSFEIPTAEELAGKKLRAKIGTDSWYLDFENSKAYTAYTVGLSFHTYADSEHDFTYSNGILTVTTKIERTEDDEGTTEMKDIWAIYKIGDDLYVGEPFTRASGSGLFATFKNTSETKGFGDTWSYTEQDENIVTFSAEGIAQYVIRTDLKDSSGISASDVAEFIEEECGIDYTAVGFYTNTNGTITCNSISSTGANYNKGLQVPLYYDGNIVFKAGKAETYAGALPPTQASH